MKYGKGEYEMTALRKQAHDLIDAASEEELSNIVNHLNIIAKDPDIADRLAFVKSLVGILPSGMDLHQAQEERLNQI